MSLPQYATGVVMLALCWSSGPSWGLLRLLLVRFGPMSAQSDWGDMTTLVAS